MSPLKTRLVVYSCLILIPWQNAAAENLKHSPMFTGPTGLNTVPNARMDEPGTIKAGISTLDPYTHGFLGLQIAEPLYISLRQTAEISNITQEADRLYPGMDLKLRLLKESEYTPEIALGMDSAIGHKRMAGEYIALSKRYNNLDFTAGLGWGRYGSAGHFENPLKAASNHFGKNRPADGEMPNGPENWFTGDKIGMFGGIEYFTPINGLSVKFDIGADRYIAESRSFDYNAPAPWSLGIAYEPAKGINTALALQGGDKIMGRLTFSGNLKNWHFSNTKPVKTEPFRPYRTELALPDEMRLSAEKNKIILHNIQARQHSASANLDLKPLQTTPDQIGQAIRHMANHAGPAIEEFIIKPTRYGLKGPKIRLMRKDFENALIHKQGSAEEIWNNAEFNAEKDQTPIIDKLRSPPFLTHYRPQNFRLLLDNVISLAEEDNGTLYRSSLIAEMDGPTLFKKIHTGSSWRLNLKDNLEKIDDIRPRAILPVRSNVNAFTENRINLDRAYTAATHSITPNLHIMGAAGYLEEMYGGAGGEILYRPYGKRYGFGADAWLALKRDPNVALATGLNGDHLLTGHINGWYEFPNTDLTLQARAGRFLAEDMGVSFGLTKDFKSGAKLEAFTTITDNADLDLFGGTTHAYHGIRITLPFGSAKYIPPGTKTRLTATPLGRDTGQTLDAPIKLYEETNALSASHIIRHWDEITD